MTWKESKRVRAILEDPEKRKRVIAATRGMKYGEKVHVEGVGTFVKVYVSTADGK